MRHDDGWDSGLKGRSGRPGAAVMNDTGGTRKEPVMRSETNGVDTRSVRQRPLSQSADAALRRVLTWLAAGYGAIFIVVNLGVYVLARRGGNA